MKKVLVINYSQSGQLDDILDNFIKPFTDVDIDRIKITLKKPFPFPWSSNVFFDAMPETVLEEPIELNDFNFKHDKYDLIIFGYQPWFLSPSLPTSSILKHQKVKQILTDTPVITVIGARNMWLNSQESVKKHLFDAGANLVGNIPLIDRNNNLVSAFTIVHWMMGGKKTRKWGFLPLPGISNEDIEDMSNFGEIVNRTIALNNYKNLQELILNRKKIDVKTNILFIESRAKKLFIIWAKLIKKKSKDLKSRALWVSIFKYYLFIALFLVSPIVLVLFNLLIRPFTYLAIKRKKAYFCGVKLNL